MRRGEGMVRRVPALLFLVPLEHGKVGDPEKTEVFRGIAGLLESAMLGRHTSAPDPAAACPHVCRNAAVLLDQASPPSDSALRYRTSNHRSSGFDSGELCRIVLDRARISPWQSAWDRSSTARTPFPAHAKRAIGPDRRRSLREISPTFGMRMSCHRQLLADLELAESLSSSSGVNASRTSIIAGRRMSGLSLP